MKLVACDLDGTIISSTGQCDDSVSEAVRYLKEKGVKFAICTGRPIDSITGLLKEWKLEGLTDYLIGNNGGEVLDCADGKRYENYLLSPETVIEIINEYEPLGVIPTMYDGAMFYAQSVTQTGIGVAKRVRQGIEQGDIRTLLKKPQFKEMFVVEPEDMERIEAYEREHRNLRYLGIKTAVDLFEFSDARLGKDTGLKVVADLLHIPMSEVMAFGDTTNDIVMLKAAGLGCCMANGSDDAKQAADRIVPSVDEQGFAKTVYEYF